MKRFIQILVAYSVLVYGVGKVTILFLGLGASREWLTGLALLFIGILTIGAGAIVTEVITKQETEEGFKEGYGKAYHAGYKAGRGY